MQAFVAFVVLTVEVEFASSGSVHWVGYLSCPWRPGVQCLN